MPDWTRILRWSVGLVVAASSGFGQSIGWRSPLPSPSEAAALLRTICPGDIQAGRDTPAPPPERRGQDSSEPI